MNTSTITKTLVSTSVSTSNTPTPSLLTGYEEIPVPEGFSPVISTLQNEKFYYFKAHEPCKFTCLVTRVMQKEHLVVLDHLAKSIGLTSYVYTGDLLTNLDDVIKELQPDGLICFVDNKITKSTLIPQLKVVSTCSVGFDHIDTNALHQRGIVLGNTPGVSVDAVSTLAVSMLCSVARRIPQAYSAIQTAGGWDAFRKNLDFLGETISGRTVGIVGLGRIGFELGRKLHFGFNCPILYYDAVRNPHASKIGAKFVPFDELLQTSDIVSIHVPLIKATKHMFNKSVFKKMKSTSILINTARGGVIDADHLYEALSTGEISAAALDVTEPEPIPIDHPLLTLPNCLITPHLGNCTTESRHKSGLSAISNLVHGITGKPLKWEVPLPVKFK